MSKALSDYPWFKFYYGRVMVETIGMTDAEFGQHIRQAIQNWCNDNEDLLPNWAKVAANERHAKTTIYSGNRSTIVNNCGTIDTVSTSIVGQLPISSPLSIKDINKEKEIREEIECEKEKRKEKTWRNDFDIYLSECNEGFRVLVDESPEWLIRMKEFYPNVKIELTLKRMFEQFWGTEAGWKNKKSKKTSSINWKQTIEATFDRSKIYVPKGEIDNEMPNFRLMLQKKGEQNGLVR